MVVQSIISICFVLTAFGFFFSALVRLLEAWEFQPQYQAVRGLDGWRRKSFQAQYQIVRGF